MKKAPIVNLNTASLIKEHIGQYNEETCDVIHAVAKAQADLFKGAETMSDYEKNFLEFLESWGWMA